MSAVNFIRDYALSHCLFLMLSSGGFPGGSVVKNLPEIQESWVLSLGWDDPVEKEMATCSSFLAWDIPWTEKHGGCKGLDMTSE